MSPCVVKRTLTLSDIVQRCTQFKLYCARKLLLDCVTGTSHHEMSCKHNQRLISDTVEPRHSQSRFPSSLCSLGIALCMLFRRCLHIILLDALTATICTRLSAPMTLSRTWSNTTVLLLELAMGRMHILCRSIRQVSCFAADIHATA